MESLLQRTHQECFTAIDNLNMNFSSARKFHFMNPEMYDENASQQLLEAIIAKSSETQINILLQRKPNPDTCDSLGKYVIEYMFEQEMYPMVIKMLNILFSCVKTKYRFRINLQHGATLPKSILKTCMMRNVRSYNNNRIKFYSLDILKAATSIEMLSKEELHRILNNEMNTIYKEKLSILNTPETRIKMINLFRSRIEMYQEMLNKCMEP